MGSCVSVHKHPHPHSAIKLHLSSSKNDNLFILKHHADPTSPPPAGSKEESFFDSQPWLESDCEDDFLSLNGDLTPSSGSTPVHHKFCSGKPPLNKALVVEAALGTPSPVTIKRLSELFKESSRSHHYVDEENAASIEKEASDLVQPKFRNSWSPASLFGANSPNSWGSSPKGVARAADAKSMKSAQCCLPRLVPSRSFIERQNKGSID